MKTLSILKICSLILLSLFLTIPCKAQQRVSLDLGSVTVWLGMSKTEALKKFSDAGYKVIDSGDMVLVDSFISSHEVRFKDGRLVYADREWYTSKDVNELDAVIGALGTLGDKSKHQTCGVLHQPLSEPGNSAERIFVSCGTVIQPNGTLVVDRSVAIIKSKLTGKSILPILRILESIGEFPVEKNK